MTDDDGAKGGTDGVISVRPRAQLRLRQKLHAPAVKFFSRRFDWALGADLRVVKRPCAILVCASTIAAICHSTVLVADGALPSYDNPPTMWACGSLPSHGRFVVPFLLMDFIATGIVLVASSIIGSWFLWSVYCSKLGVHTDLLFFAWLKAFSRFNWKSMTLLGEGQLSGRPHNFEIVIPVVDGLFMLFVLRRCWKNLAMLEEGMLRPLGLRQVRGVAYTWSMSFLALVVLICWTEFGAPDWVYFMLAIAIYSFLFLTYALFLALVVASIFAWRLVKQAARLEQTPDACRAESTCLLFLIFTVCNILTTCLPLLFLTFWEYIQAAACVARPFLDVVEPLSNIALGLFSSGVFGAALAHTQARDTAERKRVFQRRRFMKTYVPEVHDQSWQAKVAELANRGFTLKALLDFYRGLGRDYMLHYDPERSRTCDVVRCAIIPLSRERHCAYAEVMMQGVPTRPQVFCTHAWQNLFSDLCATIVADALGDETFELAAFMLNERPDELEKALLKRNALTTTYWLCIFSVNQHASICQRNRDVDTVTGERAPPCDCGHAVAWSSTPPLLPDGRSIACEMNKFDDMVGLLAASDAHFRQVVALDRRCKTLKRCWCVAEIVESYYAGLVQSIQVYSADNLKANAKDISTLRVEDMEASYPEDVAFILGKIPDKDSFNAKYRSIVQQAVGDWINLIHADKLARCGRFWFHAAIKHRFYK